VVVLHGAARGVAEADVRVETRGHLLLPGWSK
jgi:hypothetical protein